MSAHPTKGDPMTVAHQKVLIGTMPTSLVAGVLHTRNTYEVVRSLVVQNSNGPTVYLGGPEVTTTDYGYALAPNAEMAFDLSLGDEPHALVAEGIGEVRLLHLGI